MPALPDNLVETLGHIVLDMRETFEADGYTVDAALQHNRDFCRSNRPASELTRGIMIGALERASIRCGANYQDGAGGAAELHEFVEGYKAVIRLKRARRVGSDLRVKANAATAFGGVDDETLIPEAHFALGWILNDQGDSLEFFVAEIVGIEPGSPGHLIFGWVHEFPTLAIPTSDGFQPAPDDDLGEWGRSADEQDKPA